jgi:hypothetical protein
MPGSASVAAILAADTGDSSLIHNLANRAREMEALATALMRTCYDEANRLANHGSGGLEKLVMTQLYDAANAAKKKLNEKAHGAAGGGNHPKTH